MYSFHPVKTSPFSVFVYYFFLCLSLPFPETASWLGRFSSLNLPVSRVERRSKGDQSSKVIQFPTLVFRYTASAFARVASATASAFSLLSAPPLTPLEAGGVFSLPKYILTPSAEKREHGLAGWYYRGHSLLADYQTGPLIDGLGYWRMNLHLRQA